MHPVTQEQVDRFARYFRGRATSYGVMHIAADGAKTVKTVHAPAPDDAYARHLDGSGIPVPSSRPGTNITAAGGFLGVIPVMEDNTCFFGAIDLDDDGLDLHELESRVEAAGLPLVVCRSKSGGAHLYCLLREPVKAAALVDALKKFRAVLNCEKNANGKPVEIFPKQVKISPGDAGNWINIPYFSHGDTNRYAVAGGAELTLDQFLALADERAVGEHGLMHWADPAHGPFAEGPPCLQTLHKQGFPEGTRNNGLLNVGLFFKVTQPGSWEEALRAYNAGLEVALEEQELNGVVRNLHRHEYTYTCKQYPIQPLCDRKACKKQVYGIEHFYKQKRIDGVPELSNLVKVLHEVPTYRVSVDGKEMDCTLDQIHDPRAFVKACWAAHNKVFSAPKESEWKEILQGLLDTMREEEAPTDRTIIDLNDWLDKRVGSDSLDDVLLGRPALSGSRVFFRVNDFIGWLKSRDPKNAEVPILYRKLRTRGLAIETRTLKGATVELWSIPEPTNEQSQPFDHPKDDSPRGI